MDSSKPELKNFGQEEVNTKAACVRQVISRMGVWLWIARIIMFVAFGLWILSMLFKWESSEIVLFVFLILAFVVTVFGRVLALVHQQMTLLGFVTQVVCIMGVFCLFLGAVLDIRYLPIGGWVLSFFVSPLLAILRRVLLITSRKCRSVTTTVAEIAIFTVPVIIVAWILVRYAWVYR